MTNLNGGDHLPIRYRGANVGDFAPMARADISALLDDVPKRRRQVLFAIIAELVRNADKYGGVGGMPSEVEVNTDHDGTFAEVSSYGSRSHAYKLQAMLDANVLLSDETISKMEVQTIRSSRGTQKSGIGLLQVLRRAKKCREGRMVILNLQPENDLIKVSLRVYVD